MPITQVDTDASDNVVRVFCEINAGPRRGLWLLERLAERDDFDREPGWYLTHSSPGYFRGEWEPDDEYYYLTLDPDRTPETHVIWFSGQLGWRMARAAF